MLVLLFIDFTAENNRYWFPAEVIVDQLRSEVPEKRMHIEFRHQIFIRLENDAFAIVSRDICLC